MDRLSALRCLTLWRPWPWLICHAGKRIENRTWPCPSSMLGGYLAIHAGKSAEALGEDNADAWYRMAELYEQHCEAVDVEPLNPLTPAMMLEPASAVVAVALVVGCVRTETIFRKTDGSSRDPPTVVLGTVDPDEANTPWLSGPYGWVLDDVRPIEPILGVKGRQGLWKPDSNLLSSIRRRWKPAR